MDDALAEQDVRNLSLEVLATALVNGTAMDITGGVGGGGGGATSSSVDAGYDVGVVATLSFFLSVSMVLALGGNVMVILTILRHRGMRTRTNLLLANLAVADILVAVLDMPIALITIVSGKWIFSDAFCLFNGFTVGLGLMLSVHTLMWIRSVELRRSFSSFSPSPPHPSFQVCYRPRGNPTPLLPPTAPSARRMRLQSTGCRASLPRGDQAFHAAPLVEGETSREKVGAEAG